MFLLNSPLHKLPIALLIFITFFIILPSTPTATTHEPSKPSLGAVDVGQYDGIPSGMRRLFYEKINKDGTSHVMLLAQNRTHRRDILDRFKYYNEGWNITNKHYFSSTAFTAAPLLIIVVLWVPGFFLYLLQGCIHRCCCKNSTYSCPRTVCAFSPVFLILFTILAIVGCIVLYTGQAKFNRSTKGTLNFVVDQANATVERLENFSYSMASAKAIGIGQFSLPTKVKGNIDRITKEVASTATTLGTETDKNHDRISHALSVVRVALIVIAATMLLFALVGCLLSILGLRLLVQIMMTVGWVLLTVTLTLGIVFIVLHNVIGDSCIAMKEWAQRPEAHTALDDIIPCVDSTIAQDALNQGKDVTIQLLGIVNTFITNISNAQNIPAFYNQSGPLVPTVCNPYHQCAASEITLSNAANEWSKYICEVSSNGICTTVGRLTPTYYHQMVAATNVSNGIYQYAPFLVDVADCTFLWNTFSDIYDQHCPSLRRYSKLLYVGSLITSIAVMFSLMLWLPYVASKRKEQEFTKENVSSSSHQFPLVS